MEIIRSASYKRMPWKNGGGETIEIAVFPPAADFAAMDWRLSMATVAADGPFSSFPGLDRTLSVLAGTLGLEIDGVRVDLMEMSPPHSFRGERGRRARSRHRPQCHDPPRRAHARRTTRVGGG